MGEFHSNGSPIRTYGYVGVKPLYLRQHGKMYWYVTDHLGIPQKLVTNSGRVVWAAEFDSYGNCAILTEEIEQPLRLPGQYLDQETGLYYNLHRYYAPKVGRYLQVDPAGDGINPYAYVGGNPVNAIDPQGLCAIRQVGIALGAGYAQYAMDWYADAYVNGPWYVKGLAATGGFLAASWTPNTWLATATSLITFGTIGPQILAAKSTGQALGMLAKEVAEEVVESYTGVPVGSLRGLADSARSWYRASRLGSEAGILKLGNSKKTFAWSRFLEDTPKDIPRYELVNQNGKWRIFRNYTQRQSII